MPTDNLHAEPRHVGSPGDCIFYHTVDLPGGTVQGEWDLRPGIRQYLGGVDFGGKSVLDVGAATGFLTYYVESHGARVTSYDLSPAQQWDVIPKAGLDLADHLRRMAQSIARINNGYWYCHERLGSRARVVHGTVYTIPERIGPVDVVVCGSILCHVRDPFLALHNAVRLARETVVIADTVPRRRVLRWAVARLFGSKAAPFFGPTLRLASRFEDGANSVGWWDVSPEMVRQVIGFLGFEDSRVSYHHQLYKGSRRLTYTIVARRTGPTPPLQSALAA